MLLNSEMCLDSSSRRFENHQRKPIPIQAVMLVWMIHILIFPGYCEEMKLQIMHYKCKPIENV